MLKEVLNIKNAKLISKADQKEVKGGFPFPFPVSDCCSCIFVPAGQMFPIFITQSCSDPCPVDGALDWTDTGC